MMKVRLVYIVTHPMTARYLLQGQLAFMREQGMDVYLICSPGEDLDYAAKREGITAIPITMKREISPLHDLLVLFHLYRSMRRIKPHIVNAGTPKAGFLGMIAALVARVPVRVYTLRGLRLETKSGLSRLLLSLTEKIASVCAHKVICVSESLRRRYIELKLGNSSKTLVAESGSSNGVDVDRFIGDPTGEKQRILREELKIPDDVPVIGFVGRLTRDKGIAELLHSFEQLVELFPELHLVIVGDFEEGDPLSSELVERLRSHPQIRATGFVTDIAPYYGIMDILVFPSYREGFPNVPLEAAAAGIPTVGFCATGTVDAVEDGVTGLLVPLRDSRAMANAIELYLGDETLRIKHGTAARERVLQDFRREQVWKALEEEYSNLLRRSGTILPQEPTEFES